MGMNPQQAETNGNWNSSDLGSQVWCENIAQHPYLASYFAWCESTAGLDSHTNPLPSQDYHEHFLATRPSCAYASATTNPSSLPHTNTNTLNDPNGGYFNTSRSSESNANNQQVHQTTSAYSNTTWSPARPVQVGHQNAIDEASNTLASALPSCRFQSNRFCESQNQNYSPATVININSFNNYSHPFLYSSNAVREGVTHRSSNNHHPPPTSAEQFRPQTLVSGSSLVRPGGPYNSAVNNMASPFRPSLNRCPDPTSADQSSPQVIHNPSANDTTSTIPFPSPSFSLTGTEQRLPQAVTSKSLSANNAATFKIPFPATFCIYPLTPRPGNVSKVSTATPDLRVSRLQIKDTEPSSAQPNYSWMEQRQSPESGKRKRRQSYTLQQTTELETQFRLKGYLKGKARTQLCEKLQLTEQQVKTWFQNRRMKSKKEKTEQNHSKKPRPEQSSADLPTANWQPYML